MLNNSAYILSKCSKTVILWNIITILNDLNTVGTESIQTPLNFSLFVILQPFAKII